MPRCAAAWAQKRCSSVRESSRAATQKPARGPSSAANTHWDDPSEVLAASRGLGEAMEGIEMSTLSESERLANRGW